MTKDTIVDRLLDAASVVRARRLVHATDSETLRDQLTAVAIPAPPFGEAERAEWFAARLRSLGLRDVRSDPAGNVLARRPGTDGDEAAPVVLAAHLDTIFPESTKLDLRLSASRWYAPGIADNARGLAALLAVARALQRTELRTCYPILFAGTVGEEGAGDLRGVKHLFGRAGAARGARAFIAIDGAGRRRIVCRAVGSRRFRARVRGPGGHSWADYGRANPIEALGRAAAEIAAIDVPPDPPSAVNLGRIAGGTSVNAIPASAWLELDLRSEDAATLERIERDALGALERATQQASDGRRSGAALELDIERIGNRPSGRVPPDSPLVRAAREATRATGETPELVASSTDANVPMARGIPAVTLGGGGEAGGIHTPDEWFANEAGAAGVERVLLTVLATAGFAD